jgi:hypothetical protein
MIWVEGLFQNRLEIKLITCKQPVEQPTGNGELNQEYKRLFYELRIQVTADVNK